MFDYNITNGATLILKVDQGDDISIGHVYIKGLTGKTFTIGELQGSTRVSFLQDCIRDREGETAQHKWQRLIYRGQQLHDKHTLYYYNIKPDSTIHMVIRYQGGGDPSHQLSECLGCPGISDCEMLKMCWEISCILIKTSEDAWSELCDTFNVKRNVMKIITENSESAAIRCADVVHHVFHVDPTLTWDNIKRKLAQSYPYLAVWLATVMSI